MTFSQKEKHVLGSLARFGKNALAGDIREDIENRENVHYSAHEVFEELQKLETRGLAYSHASGARLYFHITDTGKAAKA